MDQMRKKRYCKNMKSFIPWTQISFHFFKDFLSFISLSQFPTCRFYVCVGLTPKYWLYSVSEKAMAPHCSALAWKIPWMEEPGRLQSMGLLRVGHNWATSLSLLIFMRWRRKWQPTPVFLPGESQGREAWWAALYGVAQSRTQLKRLSSSSSSRTDLAHEVWTAYHFVTYWK